MVDTNVIVGAVMSAEHANRAVLRRCLEGIDTPLLGNALFSEMREVLGRTELFAASPISAEHCNTLFEAYCSASEWIATYFLWRPNLRDEADNHLIELAVNGGASTVVSWNVRDLKPGELRFPGLQILNPIQYLAEVGRREKE